MARPVDIAHSPSQNRLAITWEDGITSVLEVPYLRAWCPCAGCQGHSTTIAYRPAPARAAPARIADIWEVGSYAIGIRFADGHDDGIYSWSWLAKIRYEAPPEGPKTGRFVNGVYSPD